MQTGSVEFALPWGGDFSLTSTGDIALVQDVPGSPTATVQRVTRALLSCPVLKDASGTIICRPDDLFHSSFGAGLRARIGDGITPNSIAQIQSAIEAQLSQDPYIATLPKPVVTVQQVDYQTIGVNVSFYSILGQQVTLPTINLTVDGA